MKIIIFILLVTISAIHIAKAEPGFGLELKRGYMYNDQGEKCWYSQQVKKDMYFYKRWPSKIATITFENPNCMSDSGVGLDINKQQINNVISRWYSHKDANFLTDPEELFNKSPLQIKGKCMQSRTYSVVGVLIDYKVSNNSIIGVVHGSSAGACTN